MNSCRCNVGWQGDECEECLPLEGCVMENTESGSGRYPGETPVPSSCQCKEEWSGTHCDQPKCLSSQDGSELECLHGECVKTGKVRAIKPLLQGKIIYKQAGISPFTDFYEAFPLTPRVVDFPRRRLSNSLSFMFHVLNQV